MRINDNHYCDGNYKNFSYKNIINQMFKID